MNKTKAAREMLKKRTSRGSAGSFRIGYFVLLLVGSLGSGRIEAQSHDPELIAKLERRDFTHVSDTNSGRIDLAAMLWAAGQTGCKDPDLSPSFLGKYPKYLMSDSKTGEYPSSEAKGLGFMDDGSGSIFTANPNARAVIELAKRSGCGAVSKLIKEVGEAVEHHIKWHEENQGRLAPVAKEEQIALSATPLSSTIADIHSAEARATVRAQFVRLAAAGKVELSCTYGPTNPDSTGEERVEFWYKEVRLEPRDTLGVTSAHPLIRLGATAKSSCPSTLEQAKRDIADSLNLAQQSVPYGRRPPDEVPFDRILRKADLDTYYSARMDIETYAQNHDPALLAAAESKKAHLMTLMQRACPGNDAAGKPCEPRNQMRASLEDIPDTADTATTPVLPVHATLPNQLPYQSQAQYTISVSVVDPIDLEGVTAGHTFRARLEKPIGDASRVIVPVGAEVVLKAILNPREPDPGLAHVEVSVDHAVVDGKSIALISNTVNRTFRTESTTARGQPVPLQNREITASSKLGFWVRVAPAAR